MNLSSYISGIIVLYILCTYSTTTHVHTLSYIISLKLKIEYICSLLNTLIVPLQCTVRICMYNYIHVSMQVVNIFSMNVIML